MHRGDMSGEIGGIRKGGKRGTHKGHRERRNKRDVILRACHDVSAQMIVSLFYCE